MIAPDPATLLNIKVSDNDVKEQQWLAIKHDWPAGMQSDPTELIKLLWNLSHTCRSLRVFALPLLLSVVHLKEVSELGKLRDVLRSAPYIASHIRHFSFMWNMGSNTDELQKYESWPSDYGTLLDLAFEDRDELWQLTRDTMSCDTCLRARTCTQSSLGACRCHEDVLEISFKFNGFVFKRPGRRHCSGMSGDELGSVVRIENGHWRLPQSSNDTLMANVGASGPDCRGDDRRIKTAPQFIDCFSEIAGQLRSLETFQWCSLVTSMPAESARALGQATTLKSLYLLFNFQRMELYSGCE